MFHFAVIVIGIALLPVAAGVILVAAALALEAIGQTADGIRNSWGVVFNRAPAQARDGIALAAESLGYICVVLGFVACALFFAMGCSFIGFGVWDLIERSADPSAFNFEVLLTSVVTLWAGVGGGRYFWRELRARTGRRNTSQIDTEGH